ncbi:hypothetical protein MJ575_23760 [Klebsiella pneumoniae]|nr:hypothetical protein MJ575_23760 [Klebsiella pneumoniae]
MTKFVSCRQPTIRWLVARPTIENRQRQSVGILRKSGGVKVAEEEFNLLLFVRESMQQWRAFRGIYFQLNDKNCESAVLIFQQISHHAKYRIAKTI